MRTALGAWLLTAALGACDLAPRSHDYLAMLYEPAQQCLAPSAPIDVIDTSSGSLGCDPICLVEPEAGGGDVVYVSTMCGPFPAAADTSGTSPECGPALAAYAKGSTCGDGGS